MMTGVLSWLLSWIVVILILYLLSQRTWGKTLIYYFAWLAVIFLVATQGKEIAAIFAAGKIAG